MNTFNGRYLFQEYGYSETEIEAKLKHAFHSLFAGDAENERVYFEVPANPNETLSYAYIVDIGHNDIRSEGMSYGMMLCTLLNEREKFDRLWNFAERYMWHHSGEWEGYFSWQISISDFSMMDPGAAPDGEEYFAAALLFAARQFKEEKYELAAKKIIHAMAYKEPNANVQTMMDRQVGLVRFSPATGNDFTDPSYHTIAFYRLFAQATGDTFWHQMADNSLRYLQKALHPKTGLAADYSEFDGTPKSTPWFPESHSFCGDAWRVIFNIALDASYIQQHQNKISLPSDLTDFHQNAVLKILNFFDSHRPYLADYAVDGGDFPKTPRPATAGLIAMNAAAALALPKCAPIGKRFVDDFWKTPVPRGTWRYYDGMLYLLALAACTGRFIW